MPLIPYSCECGASGRKFYTRAVEAKTFLPCTVCGKEMKRRMSAPSNSSKITVDNGSQPRAVEILPNVLELNEERAKKGPNRGD